MDRSPGTDSWTENGSFSFLESSALGIVESGAVRFVEAKDSESRKPLFLSEGSATSTPEPPNRRPYPNPLRLQLILSSGQAVVTHAALGQNLETPLELAPNLPKLVPCGDCHSNCKEDSCESSLLKVTRFKHQKPHSTESFD